MSQVQSQPTLVEQVVNAIVSEIVDGELPANSRLIQDELARAYGVSRQPVQQALLLLRDRGLVREAAGRGLIVAPIDPGFVRRLYEVRAMLDGLAARLAAERDIPRGCLAAYYPEANVLVALEDHDRRSGTPAYKSVPVRLAAHAG